MSDDAKINTTVAVKAERSQAVPLGLIVCSAMALVLAAGLLLDGRSMWWIFLAPAFLFAVAGVGAYRISYRGAEMDNPLPTTIRDGKTDISLAFDPRSLDSSQTVRILAEVMSVVANRRELPPAAGLVSNAAQAPIPNTEALANEDIGKLNAAAVAAHSALLQSVTKSAEKQMVINQPPAVAPPENVKSGLNLIE